METKKIGNFGFAKGGITSKILFSKAINTTIFAFGKGQELSTHASAFPAMILVLEGKMRIAVGSETKTIEKNTLCYLPQKKPHAVNAITKAKMLLFLAKGEKYA